MLTHTGAHLQATEDGAIKSGILKNNVPVKDLVDRHLTPERHPRRRHCNDRRG